MTESKTTNAILILMLAVLCVIGVRAFTLPAGIPQNDKLGAGVITAPQYFDTVNSSTSCPSATSTLIVAGGGARITFKGTNKDASNNIYICQASTCTASTGMTINPGGGAYVQNVAIDAYNGPYSCISDTATSTLTYISKQ